MDDNNNWFAWVVEQSLDDQSVFTQFEQLTMKTNTANWKEHVIRVSDRELSTFEKEVKQHLLSGWYVHLIQGNRIKVLFKDKSFEVSRSDSYAEIEDYAFKHGVSSNELDIKELFEEAEKLGV